ncbi:MAG: APC family permease [Vulcanisaeta sp.]|uniref:APC family permease n=1 Tax=Vulcanisaeta sp. TaxID=2020871 RepID=UPI003D0D69C2
MMSSSQSQVRLRRALTLTDYFMLPLTGMIGSGWLFAALGAAGAMGPAAILSWIIAGILFIFMIFPFAELGGLFPFSGSLARYNHYSHGTISNYLLAWAYTLGAITTVSVEAVAIVEYASYYVPQFWNSELSVLTPLGLVVAAALILLFFTIQLIGVNIYGWFNRFITAWKLLVPGLTILLLIALYFHPDYVVGKLPGGFAPYGYPAIFAGMITTGIVWAYQGFRQGLEYAGEGKNPQRDVPLGTILAFIVTMIVYILLEIAFIGAVNWEAAGVKPGDWQALASSEWQAHPFVSEAMATGIPILMGFALILLIDAIISPAGTLAVYVGTSGRNVYGMSRVGYIPEFFSQIHRKFQTPWVALTVATVIGIAFMAPFPTWYAIMSYSTVMTVYGYLQVGITNHALRKIAPDLRRPFNPPAWYIFYPLSFIVASLLIYWSGWSYVSVMIAGVMLGFPLLLLGPYRSELKLTRISSVVFAVVYWIVSSLLITGWYLNWFASLGMIGSFVTYWTLITLVQVISLLYLWFRSKHPDIRAAFWVPIYNVLLGIISYIGSLGPLSTPLVPYPWDYVVAAILSLIVYFIAINLAYETKDLKQIKEKGLPIE